MANLFHSLVVCGAGIGLMQCGGEANQNASATGGVAAGGASTSGGTSAAGGALGGANGTVSGGSGAGGSTANGGSGVVPTGSVQPWGSTDYPSTQLNCDHELFRCSPGVFQDDAVGAWVIDGSCVLEPQRPRSADDCAANEYFSCSLAVFPDDPTLVLPVSCACLPKQAGACGCSATAGCSEEFPSLCTETISICGCAVGCILR
ncbi:MAG: hypothetical protein QM756_15595 [Polyangiaceae bacterium]